LKYITADKIITLFWKVAVNKSSQYADEKSDYSRVIHNPTL